MTPLEIVLTSHRIVSFDPELGTRQVCRSLELIEKENKTARTTTYQHTTSLINTPHGSSRTDLMLRTLWFVPQEVCPATTYPMEGKLQSNKMPTTRRTK